MERSTQHENHHFHLNEGVRNTLIVLLIFSIIAVISYIEWKGKLGF